MKNHWQRLRIPILLGVFAACSHFIANIQGVKKDEFAALKDDAKPGKVLRESDFEKVLGRVDPKMPIRELVLWKHLGAVVGRPVAHYVPATKVLLHSDFQGRPIAAPPGRIPYPLAIEKHLIKDLNSLRVGDQVSFGIKNPEGEVDEVGRYYVLEFEVRQSGGQQLGLTMMIAMRKRPGTELWMPKADRVLKVNRGISSEEIVYIVRHPSIRSELEANSQDEW